uniref:Uncharacterized protein n=1 Tax=Glossina morsitans morsitans TaxID=37546 RepID=A0A1B0G8Q8_GLOMM
MLAIEKTLLLNCADCFGMLIIKMRYRMMCAHERFVSAFRNDYLHVADEETRTGCENGKLRTLSNAYKPKNASKNINIALVNKLLPNA